MKKALTLLAILVAPLFATTAWTHSAGTTVMISAQVDQFAEWSDASPVIFATDWPAIDHVKQSRTVTKSIALYTNCDAIVSAKPGLNNGILTNGSDTLQTAYKITGGVSQPDASFKPAGSNSGEFFSSQNTYTITHQKGTGSYAIDLTVQMTSPADSAPEVGVYTCGVILTAEW